MLDQQKLELILFNKLICIKQNIFFIKAYFFYKYISKFNMPNLWANTSSGIIEVF